MVSPSTIRHTCPGLRCTRAHRDLSTRNQGRRLSDSTHKLRSRLDKLQASSCECVSVTTDLLRRSPPTTPAHRDDWPHVEEFQKADSPRSSVSTSSICSDKKTALSLVASANAGRNMVHTLLLPSLKAQSEGGGGGGTFWRQASGHLASVLWALVHQRCPIPLHG